MKTSIFSALVLSFLAVACIKSAAAVEEKDVTSMFKGKLFDASGHEVKVEDLKGKMIGLFFVDNSAGCKVFTPQLINLRNLNKDKFEVVLVSTAKTADEQVKFMKATKMPWPAVEFNEADSKAFVKKYKATVFPKLCIFAPDGQYLTDNGIGDIRSNVSSAMAKWERMKKK